MLKRMIHFGGVDAIHLLEGFVRDFAVEELYDEVADDLAVGESEGICLCFS